MRIYFFKYARFINLTKNEYFPYVLAVMEIEDSDYLYRARQRMSTLSSCFAQLTHKAQTIFQNSAKVEVRICLMCALRVTIFFFKFEIIVLTNEKIHTTGCFILVSLLQKLNNWRTSY
jgi:hypothetical protein